jgi:hypothetical protein
MPPPKNTTTSGTADPKPSAKDQQDIREEMAARYGWAISFLKSNPELWKLFLNAVQGEWAPDQFVAKLRNTKWFKTHGDTARKNAVLQKTDPATYQRRFEQKKAQIQDLSVQLTGVYLTNGQASLVARHAMDFDWDEAQLRNTLSLYLKQVGGTKGHYGGEAGAAEQELRQYAADQGVTLSDPTIKKWLKGIVAQRNTLQDYKSWIQGQAESSYSGLGNEIRAGKTVRQLADPYVQEMANTLELNPAAISLKDPTIADALQWQNPDGKVGVMSVGAFRRKLLADNRYLGTKAATDKAMDVGNSILKDFGLM